MKTFNEELQEEGVLFMEVGLNYAHQYTEEYFWVMNKVLEEALKFGMKFGK